MEVKFIDLFAGIGGFRSGLEKAGHKCVGYVEWDKFARQSYQAMYDTKGEFTDYDIQRTKGVKLPEADLWTFGSPCTNISIAGNRTGIKGKESRMFFEVIRLLKERAENQKTLPTYFIMESVKNLLSSNEGRDFAEVIYQMDKVGYDAEWCVFDSAEVVPQHRERVYIIGHLRGQRTRGVFPIQRQSKGSVKSKIKAVANDSKTNHNAATIVSDREISKTIDATSYKHVPRVAIHQVGNYLKTSSFGGNPQIGRVYSPNGISPTLNTIQGGGREPKVLISKYERTDYGKQVRKDYESKKVKLHRSQIRHLIFKESNTSNTLTTVQKDNMIAIPVSSSDIAVKACLTPDRAKKRQNGRRFKENGEPAFTVTVADHNGVMLKNGDVVAIRKLTPRECWRLQGFSDEQFDKAKNVGVSNSQLYKQAGNAVTVPVVRAIGEKML